jgi:hypothetical protein
VCVGACARRDGSKSHLDHPRYRNAKEAMVCVTVVSGVDDGNAYCGGREEG